MGVICFASLKGGVGKTSLAVNTAHAFAERGCQTLLIDLDPSCHASRLLCGEARNTTPTEDAPLARLFLSNEVENVDVSTIVDAATTSNSGIIYPSRDKLDCLPAGAELRHFLWGRGSRRFGSLFPKFLFELGNSYDYVVIDTQPDYNVITRNAIAGADVIAVPVDSSAMSIHCLEELIATAGHIKGPVWAIVRSMINRMATTVQKMSQDRLVENLKFSDTYRSPDEDEDVDAFAGSPDEFMSLLRQHERENQSSGPAAEMASPIYLLNAGIHRTEQQNKLTFAGQTAFDRLAAKRLAEQYAEVAKELEIVVSLSEESEADMPSLDTYFAQPVSA